jgi:hypothetical protein
LDKIEKFLRYAIPEIDNLIQCPFCKEMNPPDKQFCVHCSGIINPVKGEIKQKKDDENE